MFVEVFAYKRLTSDNTIVPFAQRFVINTAQIISIYPVYKVPSMTTPPEVIPGWTFVDLPGWQGLVLEGNLDEVTARLGISAKRVEPVF